MAFVLDVERLGRAVEIGELTLANAVTALIEARYGALTRWAAVYELRHWRTAGRRYGDENGGVVDLQDGTSDRWPTAEQYRATAC